MKVEDCIVSVERRTLGGCLDLAFVFTREFAAPLFRLTSLFAIPSCALVWGMTAVSPNMLFPSLFVFLFFSSLFSGALVSAMGPQVFGVPISIRQAMRSFRKRMVGYLLLTLFYRFLQLATFMCFAFPAAIVTAQMGHMPEVLLLEHTPLTQVTSRLSWLSKGGGFSRNLSHVIGLAFVWILISLGVFITIDVLSNALINMPVFVGRLPNPRVDFSDRMMAIALDSPLFLTVMHIAIWIPLPLVRLAWFFCYLDQRIRNECWDIELQFRVESRRLEELT